MTRHRTAHSSESFYSELPPFTRFDELTDSRHFAAAPPDWFVVISDVRGSTEAIEEGRYKDVNTIGAAGIVTVSNALGSMEFPFVFGGDGATMLLSPQALEKVSSNLLALADLARAQFGLELLVGCVRVGELVEAGTPIEVARFQFEGTVPIAVLRGGGAKQAEQWIKGRPADYALEGAPGGSVDLSGLSCRWQPIPSQHGRVLSLLVAAGGDAVDAVYDEVLAQLRETVGGELGVANPVHTERMRYRSGSELKADERRYHGRRFSPAWLARRVEIFLACLIFRRGVKPPLIDTAAYQRAMRSHSDHRKFDDMLRMVIDCTGDQAKAIRDLLEARRRDGQLHFGIHESDSSLMTCFVGNLKSGGHIHFIDGAGGGYALAALELKGQVLEMGGA